MKLLFVLVLCGAICKSAGNQGARCRTSDECVDPFKCTHPDTANCSDIKTCIGLSDMATCQPTPCKTPNDCSYGEFCDKNGICNAGNCTNDSECDGKFSKIHTEFQRLFGERIHSHMNIPFFKLWSITPLFPRINNGTLQFPENILKVDLAPYPEIKILLCRPQ